MLRIALCDDEPIFHQIFINELEKTDFHYSLDTYLSGESLISSDLEYDVIFIDIMMKGIDGIETGKSIK